MRNMFKGKVEVSLVEIVFGASILSFLLSASAFLYVQDRQQRNAQAFSRALINEDGPAIAQMLRDDPAIASHFDSTSLLMWSRGEILKQILSAGADACRVTEGVTPLHIISHYGGTEDVGAVFKRCPANINARDPNGFTPRDWAILSGKNANADFLRAHGGVRGDEQRGA